MREISLPSDPQYGVEPVLILAVQWAKFISVPIGTDPHDIDLSILGWHYYADKTFQGIDGKILSCDNVDSTLNLDGNQSSISVNMTLDDSDGELLKIINVASIHKADANLYQCFEGVDRSNMFSIFEGQINSTVIWSDVDRTLKITIVSKLEDVEVGFSPEEGDIGDLPEEMVGEAWPMGFGTVIKAKAIQTTKLPTGITQTPLFLPDKSLPDEITRVEGRSASWYSVANVFFLGALQALNSDMPEIANQLTDQGNAALALGSQYFAYTDNLSTINLEQENKRKFNNACKILGNFSFNVKGKFDVGGTEMDASVSKSKENGLSILKIKSLFNDRTESTGLPTLDGPPERADYIYIEPGTEVIFKADYPIRYVVNILDCSILRVYAYRRYGSLRRLTEIPGSYWHPVQMGVASIQGGFFSINCIQFKKALTYYDKEKWDSDDIYVTYVGEISTFRGVMLEVISRYTDFGIDEDSFFTVPNFPINGILTEKMNLLQFLQEFCWQNKVATWLREGTFYFQYLPNFGDFGGVLTLKDIISDSLEITFSPTESLATKITGTWRFDQSIEKDNKIVIRNNVRQYGLIERNYRIWALNAPLATQSVLSFWLWRYSNTWKRLKFKLPIAWLKLETFDVIAIDQDVVDAYVLSKDRFMWSQVVNVFYNTSENLVEVEVELPYKLGDVHPDDGYFPFGSFNIGLMSAFHYARNYDGPMGWDGDSPYLEGPSVQTIPITDINSFYDGGGNEQGGHISLALSPPNSMNGTPKVPGFRAVSDMGGELNTTFSQTTSLGGSMGTTTDYNRDRWNYAYWDIKAPDVPSVPTAKNEGMAFPGIINERKDKNYYNCVIYPNGLKGTSTKVLGYLLQKNADNPDETVPKGTWAIFVKTTRKGNTNNEPSNVEEYWFQTPIWM